MYALVSLFALLSVFTLVCALRGAGRTWWWLHCGANLCLIASHYLTVFMLPVLGAMLLLWERRLSVRTVGWFFCHGLLALLLLVWIGQIPSQPEHLYSYYDMPAWRSILANFLAGDSTVLSANSFFPSADAWAWFPSDMRYRVIDGHWFFDGILVFFSIVALGGAVVMLGRGLLEREFRKLFAWGLLLLWALLPLALILAVSLLWRPLYGSRYIFYSAFALYLMLGGLLASLRDQRLYATVMTVIVLTYGYQLSLALPAQTRAAWRQAYEQVQERAADQAVLLLEDPFWLPVLTMNTENPPSIPIVAAFQRDTLCDVAVFIEDLARRSPTNASCIWVLLVLTTDFDETPFIQCLRGRGMDFERTFYSGDRRLVLFRVFSDPHTEMGPVEVEATEMFQSLVKALAQRKDEPLSDGLQDAIRYAPDWEAGVWLRLGTTLAQYEMGEWAMAAFARAAQESLGALTWLHDTAEFLEVPLDAARLASLALAGHENRDAVCERLRDHLAPAYYAGNADRLRALGDAAVALVPECFAGYACLGFAAHIEDDHDRAIYWFERALNLDACPPAEVFEAFGISLIEEEKADEARRLLEAGVNAWSDRSWLQIRLAVAYAMLDDHTAAAAVLRQVRREMPDDSYVGYRLIESLLETERYEEAAALARQPDMVESADNWVLAARWRAFAGVGEDSEAAALFRRLSEMNALLKPLYTHLYVAPNPGLAREEIRKLEADGAPLAPELRMTLNRLDRTTN